MGCLNCFVFRRQRRPREQRSQRVKGTGESYVHGPGDLIGMGLDSSAETYAGQEYDSNDGAERTVGIETALELLEEIEQLIRMEDEHEGKGMDGNSVTTGVGAGCESTPMEPTGTAASTKRKVIKLKRPKNALSTKVIALPEGFVTPRAATGDENKTKKKKCGVKIGEPSTSGSSGSSASNDQNGATSLNLSNHTNGTTRASRGSADIVESKKWRSVFRKRPTVVILGRPSGDAAQANDDGGDGEIPWHQTRPAAASAASNLAETVRKSFTPRGRRRPFQFGTGGGGGGSSSKRNSNAKGRDKVNKAKRKAKNKGKHKGKFMKRLQILHHSRADRSSEEKEDPYKTPVLTSLDISRIQSGGSGDDTGDGTGVGAENEAPSKPSAPVLENDGSEIRRTPDSVLKMVSDAETEAAITYVQTRIDVTPLSPVSTIHEYEDEDENEDEEVDEIKPVICEIIEDVGKKGEAKEDKETKEKKKDVPRCTSWVNCTVREHGGECIVW